MLRLALPAPDLQTLPSHAPSGWCSKRGGRWCVTSGGSARRSGFPRMIVSVGALLLAAIVAGCGRPGSSADPTPTHIPQPTPDPTMVEVIRGNASPVVYLPPLEIRGSPTPVPAAAKPGAAPSGSRSVPKPAAPVREAPPAREPAPASKPVPASKPAPSNPAPRPTTAPKPAPSNGSGSNGPGAPAAAPAIINPNTILPGGPARPNATPGR